MFASDDEATKAPAAKPAAKAKAAAAKPAKAAKSKQAEAPSFPNKSECNEAEAKYHALLAQVLWMICHHLELDTGP